MRPDLENFPGLSLIKNPNLVFVLSLGVFVVDNVTNNYLDIPIFIPYAILLLPLIWLSLISCGKKQPFLVLFSAVFIVVAILNMLVNGFNKSNISDLAFILLFSTSYFYYLQFQSRLSIQTIHIFSVVAAILLGVTFLGINSKSHLTNDRQLKNLELAGISFDSLIAQGKPVAEFEKDFPDSVNVDSLIKSKLKKYFPQQTGIDTLKNLGVGVMPGIHFKKEPLDKIEKGRVYHQGFFRVPHVAAYFFGFLALFYLWMFAKTRSKIHLLIVLLLIVIIFYNGVRTFIIATVLALMIYFFIRRNLWFFVAFLAMLTASVIFRFQIYDLTSQTVFSPISSLLITAIDNPDRLSRVALYLSWFREIQDFSWYDFMIGKGFYLSKMANLKNLFIPTWYHNDFISIFFSYGAIATMLYVIFLIKIFRDNSTAIKSSMLLFIFFFTMLFTAIINGLYYYFPIFLLFIFLRMSRKTETEETQ